MGTRRLNDAGLSTTPRHEYITFGRPCLDDEEIRAVTDVIRSGWIGTGPVCHRFEKEFAAWKGARYSLALNSCTAALFLSLEYLGARPGTEVLMTPMTFASCANVVEHLGATPVFTDIDPITGNVDPSRLEERITEKTAVVMVVHLAGRPVDLAPVLELRRRYGFKLVEDASHAIETTWQGRPAGTIGDAGCFSFYATKNLTTAEGGMILSDDQGLVDRCKIRSLHGLDADAWHRYSDEGYRHYLVLEPGHKFNLTDLQAALGLVQLQKLERHLENRRRIWDFYLQRLADLPLVLPPPARPGDAHARHLFAPLLKLEEVNLTRDELLAHLHQEGIGTGVHYVSLHLHPFYRDKYGYRPDDFPNALRFSQRTFSLPLSGNLPMEKAEHIADRLREILHRHAR